jgi:hypothetical protein
MLVIWVVIPSSEMKTVPPKRRYLRTSPNDVTAQKTNTDIFTAVKTSSLINIASLFKSLNTNGNYTSHLLQQAVTLYLCVSYDSHCKQRLFP